MRERVVAPGSASGPELRVLDSVPAGFSSAAASELKDMLGGPTLMHLEGRREPALFVSILLHGNEVTGLTALQRVLSRHHDQMLPRALSIFVGNVEAAQHGLRRLEHQPDYNRIWPGADPSETPEHALAARVTVLMRERGMFAAIDIHNNTGTNPLYACLTRLDDASLQLAALFARTVVYFQSPRGVQTLAFASLAPSITIECGKSGSEPGVTRAAELVNACLRLDHFPAHAVSPQDMDLFHTVAVVKVPDGITFAFGDDAAPIVFPVDLDRMNFRELQPDSCLAVLAPGVRPDVRDDAGRDVFDDYFAVRSGRLVTRRTLMPAMLTQDVRVIRQDCLCYLMDRVDLRARRR